MPPRVPEEPPDIERDLAALAVDMRRLENEYNMYFAGRLPRPPYTTRKRVETMLRRWDQGYIDNLTMRFRFTTLQSRYATFSELWERGMRAREEGRSGPLVRGRAAAGAPPEREARGDRVLHVAALADPVREDDKLHALYDSLMEARRSTGAEAVPYEKFAGMIRVQVDRLRSAGAAEVAFRVAVADGKVSLLARGTREAGVENTGGGGPGGPPPRARS